MQITIHAAKTTLSRLIERAHAGEEVVIARGDVPVARLVPIIGDAPGRRAGTLRGFVTVPAAFFEPLPADELEAWEGRLEASARHPRAPLVGDSRRRAVSESQKGHRRPRQ